MMKIIFQSNMNRTQFLDSGAGILEVSLCRLGGEHGGGCPPHSAGFPRINPAGLATHRTKGESNKRLFHLLS